MSTVNLPTPITNIAVLTRYPLTAGLINNLIASQKTPIFSLLDLTGSETQPQALGNLLQKWKFYGIISPDDFTPYTFYTTTPTNASGRFTVKRNCTLFLFYHQNNVQVRTAYASLLINQQLAFGEDGNADIPFRIYTGTTFTSPTSYQTGKACFYRPLTTILNQKEWWALEL